MSAFYFALGVVLAGAVALVREFILERQRWKREDRGYDRVTRAARRLIADELDTNRGHLAMMLRNGVWPVPEFVERGNLLPADEWERNKDRLAEALEDEHTWMVASGFHYSLGQLRARALIERSGVTIDDADRENLQVMRDQAGVLELVLSENAPLPDDWREQVATMRQAGDA